MGISKNGKTLNDYLLSATKRNGKCYFDTLGKGVVNPKNDSKYYQQKTITIGNQTTSIEFIPIGLDLELEECDGCDEISFDDLELEHRKAIYDFFLEINKQDLPLPIQFHLCKSKKSPEIYLQAINVYPEDGSNSLYILELLKKEVTKPTKKPINIKNIFHKTLIGIISIFLIIMLSYFLYDYYKIKMGKPIVPTLPIVSIKAKSCATNFLTENLETRVWCFYKLNFPNLYASLEGGKMSDPNLKKVARSLLKPEYIASLLVHYQSSYWGGKNKKSDTVMRGVLYDYFNKNSDVRKILEKNELLLDKTQLLNLSTIYIYSTDFHQDIYYWTNSSYEISKGNFNNLLDTAHIKSGWKWISDSDAGSVDLNFKKLSQIPLRVVMLGKNNDSKLLASIVIKDEEGDEKRTVLLFLNGKSITVNANLAIVLKNHIENNILPPNYLVSWYQLDATFINPDQKGENIFQDIYPIPIEKLKLIRNNLTDEMKVADIRDLVVKNDKSPLVDKKEAIDICIQEEKGCGFRTDDPIVAMLLFNLIKKRSLEDTDNVKLIREDSDLHESHIYIAKSDDGTNNARDMTIYDADILEELKGLDTIDLSVAGKHITFYQIRRDDPSSLKVIREKNQFVIYDAKLAISDCIDRSEYISLTGKKIIFNKSSNTNECTIDIKEK